MTSPLRASQEIVDDLEAALEQFRLIAADQGAAAMSAARSTAPVRAVSRY